jgi:hypothetical protein
VTLQPLDTLTTAMPLSSFVPGRVFQPEPVDYRQELHAARIGLSASSRIGYNSNRSHAQTWPVLFRLTWYQDDPDSGCSCGDGSTTRKYRTCKTGRRV